MSARAKAIARAKREHGGTVRRQQPVPKPPVQGARLLTSVPETLPLIDGRQYVGSLGAPKPGKYGISRTILLDEGGKYWLPNHATLDPVFDLPQGSRVVLIYKGKAHNRGGQSFNDWEAWELPDGVVDDNENLPF